MALDGIYLSCIKNEIKPEAVMMRVEKVHQPSKEEIVLVLRGRNGAKKLLLSARSNSPRVHFTNCTFENPKTPPMLCMLFRKYLTNAMITDIRQYESDRILFIDFDATDEIGEKIKLTISVEIIGQHSNIILIDGNNRIIDSIKRVDINKSPTRQTLPGLEYVLPKNQQKTNLSECKIDELVEKVLQEENKYLSTSLMNEIQGISPIVSREIVSLSAGDDIYCYSVNEEIKQKLKCVLSDIQKGLKNNSLGAYIYFGEEGKPKDFSFVEINQYGSLGECKKQESFSALLDEFYFEKDRIERTRQKSGDLFRMLNTTLARISKKINLQKVELEKCEDKDDLKIKAELINAYQYMLEKGSSVYEVENYYDENKIIKIKADPALSPNANSQKYYKEYRKAKTAEVMLVRLIEENEQELVYIESVIDELTRSETEAEINEIRRELSENGYGKKKIKQNEKKKSKPLDPIEYVTSDGFKVLVGRNNVQNDFLTFKKAKSNDMWLHTKDIHGSHVIIVCENREISDKAIEEASVIAAYHSKARESYQVPVDYTFVKNLKKPIGAKPGKVIFNSNYTIIANPDINLINLLKK